MNKQPCKIMIFLILIPLAGCTNPALAPTPLISNTSPPIPTSTPSVSAETTEEIDQFLTNMNKEQRMFNGIALVAKDGKVLLHKAYGMADREQNIPLELDMVMPFWDIGIVPSAVLLLEKQGMLALDDPICQYLEDCPATWSDINVRDVLYDQSGIPNPYTNLSPVEREELWSRPDREDELVRLARDLPLETIPALGTLGSPTNFSILVKIIESASGMTAQDYIQESILTPLGITALGESYTAADIKPIGYVSFSLPVTGDPLPEDLIFPSIVVGTVHDLYLLFQEYLTPKVLPKSIIDFLWDEDIYHYQENLIVNSLGKVKFPNPSTLDGYGTWDTVGYTEGYGLDYLISPEDQVIIILSKNEKDRDSTLIIKTIKDKLVKK